MTIDLSSDSHIKNLKKESRDFRLVFTSGCFDLLHSGHIYFFNEMIKRVNRFQRGNKINENFKTLVVIHSDKEVKLHKGPSRPIFNSEDRLILLDNIKGIDYTGVWDGWESIVDLVFMLEPDYLVTNKASLEFTNWDNNYRAVAKKINAKLIGISKTKVDNSTSKIIEKIKNI